MADYQDIEAYVNSLNREYELDKFPMDLFFKDVCGQFYPEMDFSFMGYFLEIINDDNKFVIHHSKLIEYGCMNSTRSSNVKDKLTNLGLEETKDYIVEETLHRGKSGAQLHKNYYLTHRAFRLCLMRAKRYRDQPIDPVSYCDKYIILEQIYKWSFLYERSYQSIKIRELIEENNKLLSRR